MWIGDGCFCSPLGGRGLLSFVNLGPVGGAASALHLLSFHFFLFHPSVLCLSDLVEKRASWPPSPSSLCLPDPLFHPSLPSLTPFGVAFEGAERRLSWPHASRSIGPIVYSLHPDTKDIKLTDQRAGARARLINEALGSGEGGDGWREGGEGRREGWTGRLTDAQSAAQSMGTFAELR